MIHRGIHIYGGGSLGRELFNWPEQEALTPHGAVQVRHALCGKVLLPSDSAVEAEILADAKMSAYEAPYSEVCTGCVAVLVRQGLAPMPVHVFLPSMTGLWCGASWGAIPLRQASLGLGNALAHPEWVTCIACKAELTRQALAAAGGEPA